MTLVNAEEDPSLENFSSAFPHRCQYPIESEARWELQLLNDKVGYMPVSYAAYCETKWGNTGCFRTSELLGGSHSKSFYFDKALLLY